MPPPRPIGPPAPKRQCLSPTRAATPASSFEPDLLCTVPNEFGLYREYPSQPAKEVDEMEDIDNLCDSPGLAAVPKNTPEGHLKSLGVHSPGYSAANNVFAPFLNASVFRLMSWFYSGSNLKSVADLDRLVKEVLLAEDFDTKHLKGFSAEKELHRLDDQSEGSSPFAKENGWHNSTVKILLPSEGVKHSAEEVAPVLEIPNVYHRSLVEAIVSAFKDESSVSFHYTPFRSFWKPTSTSTPERVITELYNSDVFYEEHVKIMQQQPEPGQPSLENAIAAMMMWSDSTHLANFGNASLWPIYMLFGNQSKYSRCKPSSFASHHVAYIPSVSLTIFLHILYLIFVF